MKLPLGGGGGVTVGVAVGVGVGDGLGVGDGEAVGEAVGVDVGDADGEGAVVGVGVDGTAVGEAVGLAVGGGVEGVVDGEGDGLGDGVTSGGGVAARMMISSPGASTIGSCSTTAPIAGPVRVPSTSPIAKATDNRRKMTSCSQGIERRLRAYATIDVRERTKIERSPMVIPGSDAMVRPGESVSVGGKVDCFGGSVGQYGGITSPSPGPHWSPGSQLLPGITGRQ
jgi:hypothetical protein